MRGTTAARRRRQGRRSRKAPVDSRQSMAWARRSPAGSSRTIWRTRRGPTLCAHAHLPSSRIWRPTASGAVGPSLTLKRQDRERAARVCSNRGAIRWPQPTLACHAPTRMTAIDHAANSSHRGQPRCVAELCRSNDQGGSAPRRARRRALPPKARPARAHRHRGATTADQPGPSVTRAACR